MQKYKKIIEELQKQKNTNVDETTISMEEDLEQFMKENITT